MFSVFSKTRQILIASHVDLADSFFSRMKGLLGRKKLFSSEGVIITKCNSIHMFFMQFNIDAVFLDKNNVVVGLVQNIKPFQVSPIFWKANKVIEFKSGTISQKNIQKSDEITLVLN